MQIGPHTTGYMDGVRDLVYTDDDTRTDVLFYNDTFYPFGADNDYRLYPLHFGRHLEGTINPNNTRPLPDVVRAIIRSGFGELKWLDIDPGAGVASYQAYLEALESDRPPHIQMITKTPLNPYIGLKMDSTQFLSKALECQEVEDKYDDVVHGRFWGPDCTFFRFEKAFEVQNMSGVELFDHLDQPYIDRQHVGIIANDFRRSHLRNIGFDVFDLVYDGDGEFQSIPPYISRPLSHRNKVAAKIRRLMKDSGVFYARNAVNAAAFKTKRGDVIFGTRDDFRADYSEGTDPNNFALLAGMDSLLAQKARKSSLVDSKGEVVSNELGTLVPKLLAS